MPSDTCIMLAEELTAHIQRLGETLLASHGNCSDVALVGIQRRGVDLARRLGKQMSQQLGRKLPYGTLDIALYRDDWTTTAKQPEVLQTTIPFPVDGKKIILIDDVLFTGRTIRAALEALADYGRPAKVELLVLVDRGHRELPICADYVGIQLPTQLTDRVDVLLEERDGVNEIRLVTMAR